MKTLRFFLFLIPLITLGQEAKRFTLASAGYSTTITQGGENYYLLQSVGQGSVIATFSNGQSQLRQGYIQPLPAILLGGDPNGLEAVIWPNPFVNGVVARMEQGLESPVQMQLFDMSGRLIYDREYESDTQLSIPLLNLAQGTYFIKLITDRKAVTQQLIKL